MGYYIDPPFEYDERMPLSEGEIAEEEKTNFLKKHGLLIYDIESLEYKSIPKEFVLVVRVYNGQLFTAVGIAFCESEFNAFTDSNDNRKKVYYLVRKDAILKIHSEYADILNYEETD